VGEYLRRAREAGLSWPLPEDMSEDRLYELLFPKTPSSNSRVIPCPDWSVVHTELRKKSVTLRLLWVEYREAHPDGYGYSQFCALYRQWAKLLKSSMRLTHKAGEKVFVDYAGQTVPIVDPSTGEVREVQIFIGVLGASNYTYAEAHESQDLFNWIMAHVRMFSFFGGVPEIVVPDNLKARGKHPCRYEPDLNPTYQDLAEHYGMAVIPTRVRKPKDKAKVEVGVQVVERWILARLRNHTFFKLADLNRAIRELLNELNTRQMEHLGGSRRELFEELDQPVLKPLPEQAYEYAVWKKARVNIDYHVEFDKHYYSVSHKLKEKDVYVRATQATVEIFCNRKRVASHRRSRAQGRHTTVSEHMPPAHQKYAEWSPERITRWAQTIGSHTAQVVQAPLDSRKHPNKPTALVWGCYALATATARTVWKPPAAGLYRPGSTPTRASKTSLMPSSTRSNWKIHRPLSLRPTKTSVARPTISKEVSDVDPAPARQTDSTPPVCFSCGPRRAASKPRVRRIDL